MLSSLQLTKICQGHLRKSSILAKIIPIYHATNVFHTQSKSVSTASSPQPRQKPYFTFSRFPKGEFNQLNEGFPEFFKKVTKESVLMNSDAISDVLDYISEAIRYNLLRGEKEGAFLCLIAYKAFENPESLTPEKQELARIIGWSVELIKSAFEIWTDIVDGKLVRLGAPSWYLKPNVGVTAIADAALMGISAQTLVDRCFQGHPLRSEMMVAVKDADLKIVLSNAIAKTTANKGNPRLDYFTMANFEKLTTLGLSNYQLTYPLNMALYMANIGDPQIHREVTGFCEKLGNFIVIKEDFLDCFENQNTIGQHQDHLTWLSVKALERCNAAQRKFLELHYGKQNKDSWDLVRNIYQELGLPEEYAVHKEQSFKELNTFIGRMSERLPHDFFLTLVADVYDNN